MSYPSRAILELQQNSYEGFEVFNGFDQFHEIVFVGILLRGSYTVQASGK